MAASISKNPLDKKEAPRLQPLLFEALEANGDNYMRWSIDAKTNLTIEELEGALISFNAELRQIVDQLRLCRETVTEWELIDKTLQTFPFASALLAQ